MPLHDWTDRPGWDGFHQLWIVELLRWVKHRLPEGFRAYLGTVPALAVDIPGQRPDVHVRGWLPTPGDGAPSAPPTPGTAPLVEEPDEQVAVAALDPQLAVHITQQERLVAALELISPRNKDLPDARDSYRSRYVGYLLHGVHLLLVDVHRRPLSFSFADAIAVALGMVQPSCLPPLAVSYRVGDAAATGGRMLGIWRRPLAVAEPLPTMRLPLTVDLSVPVDLEQTYMSAAADAYLT